MHLPYAGRKRHRLGFDLTQLCIQLLDVIGKRMHVGRIGGFVAGRLRVAGIAGHQLQDQGRVFMPQLLALRHFFCHSAEAAGNSRGIHGSALVTRSFEKKILAQ